MGPTARQAYRMEAGLDRRCAQACRHSARDLAWGKIMAASVTVTVPLIVLVLVFQRRIVSGLMAGAIKG